MAEQRTAYLHSPALGTGPIVADALYAKWQSFGASLVLVALALLAAASGCLGGKAVWSGRVVQGLR